MKKTLPEKTGIKAFDVWNNDALVDELIELNEKFNQIIDYLKAKEEQTDR